ncbi:MAG: hypothetical protein V7722_03745, partial [Porticoccus sp.]
MNINSISQIPSEQVSNAAEKPSHTADAPSTENNFSNTMNEVAIRHQSENKKNPQSQPEERLTDTESLSVAPAPETTPVKNTSLGLGVDADVALVIDETLAAGNTPLTSTTPTLDAT